jgi:D-sedoheptulose 7-phosphate isomerase
MKKLFEHLENMTRAYPDLAVCQPEVQYAFDLLSESYRKGGKVLLCGNGGSAGDSEHIVGELMKGFTSKRPVPEAVRSMLSKAFPEDGEYLSNHLQGALPAISLVSQTSLITAFANDVAADMIFAQQVYGYGLKGDVLIGISTSGTSKNVVHALQVARAMSLRTIGLTGRSGGKMKAVCDVTICVPAESTPEVQQRHIAVYHALCLMLEEEFFPS